MPKMPRTIHPPVTKQASRKKRRIKQPLNCGSVSAAVSIPEPLYLQALDAADETDEGNFSRYVRNLIRRDLQRAS
jgi:hypothetical protein